MKRFFIFFVFLALLFTGDASAYLKHVSQQHMPKYNMLLNPGAENGKARWDKTGSSTFSLETTNPLFGTTSFKWDPSATGEYFTSSATNATIPIGLRGKDCEIRMYYRNVTTAGDIQLYAYDGTDEVHEKLDLLAVGASDDPLMARAAFTCPSSGSLRARLESTTNAAEIIVDDFWVGSNLQNFDYSTAEVVGSGYWPYTANCDILNGTDTLDSFTDDTDCPGITVDNEYVGDWQTTDYDKFKWTINNLPAGVYKITMTFSALCYGATRSCAYAINDGTTTSPAVSSIIYGSGAENRNNVVIAYFEYTAAGNRTFDLYGDDGGGTHTEIQLNYDTSQNVNVFIERFPLASQKAVSVDTSRWYIQGNVGGANPSLGVVAKTTYTPIENASLDMTLKSGSANAEITCDGSNSPDGLDCGSGGTPQIGVAWVPPFIGDFLMCWNMGHQMRAGSGATIGATFQIIETPINDDTTFTEETKIYGQSRIQMAATGINRTIVNVSMCGIITIDSMSKKAHRIYYEQEISGSPSESEIYADRSSDNGQREVSFSIVPIRQGIQQAYVMTDIAPTHMSASGATKGGYFVYIDDGSTTYYGGNRPDITSDAGAVTIQGANFIPYQMNDGTWRLRVNVRFSTASVGAGTTLTATISGITFKNASNFYQAGTAMCVGTTPYLCSVQAKPNTGDIEVYQNHATTQWMINGDWELDEIPDWAWR